MTTEQAKQFIAKHPDAISFVRESHLEELSPLYEVHIEAVTVKKDDFHHLGAGVFYPKKETTDRFGNAAGISFAKVDVSTRREDAAYVGRAYPQELGPDGKMIQWAPAEYEFDPEIRAQEDVLRDTQKEHPKYTSDAAKQLVLLGYKKVGRRRADTGARAAAIISAIGMPTGFKNLFNANEPPTATRTFLFSRIIVNSKNEMVLNRALDSMFATSAQLYGPSAVAQIEGDVGTATLERNVTPGGTADETDDFGSAEPEEQTIGEEKQKLWQSLVDYEAAYTLPPKAKQHVEDWRGDLQHADESKMRELVEFLAGWTTRHPEAQV